MTAITVDDGNIEELLGGAFAGDAAAEVWSCSARSRVSSPTAQAGIVYKAHQAGARPRVWMRET